MVGMLRHPRAHVARTLPLALTTLVLGLVVAPGARAAPTWLGPTTLSAAGQSVDAPHVASSSLGDAVAVWKRSDGSNQRVQVASRPAGGAWSAPASLSPVGQDATSPRAAADASGTSAVAWSRSTGIHQHVQAAVRPAGGAWPTVADTLSTVDAYDPDITLDGHGNALAVWRCTSGGADAIVQASYRPAGGLWQSPISLSALGQDAYDPHVAFDGAGNALAVWDRFDGSHQVVQASYRPAGGTWQAPVAVSGTGQGAQHPQVAFDGLGNAVVAFDRDGTTSRVQVAVRTAAGPWQVPVFLSAAGSQATDQQVAADPQGNLVVAWDRDAGAHWVAEAAARPAGGIWQAPITLSDPSATADDVQVGIDAQGRAIATWDWGMAAAVQASVRPLGGTWSAPVVVAPASGSADGVSLAVDAQGDAVAAWMRSDGANQRMQAAGFDGAGPQARGFVAPASAAIGAPVTFSVAPLDVWSSLGATSWTFGDGGTAAGTSVTHAFGAAGTYPVTMTSTDALGNATTKTVSVTVPAAGPGDGGGGDGGGPGGGDGGGDGGDGGPPRDTTKPKVTLAQPACRKGLSPSRCRTLRAKATSWRTVRGTASDAGGSGVAKVEVAAARKAGGKVYVSNGRRFAASTTKRFQTAYRPAKVAGSSWSLKLPPLARGTYLLRIRATDGAGNASAVVTRTLKLR